MALNKEELRLLLSSEEPNYMAIAAQIGTDSIPALDALSTDAADIMTATKAVYLSSLLTDSRAHDVVIKASKSTNALLKIASASALVNLPDTTKYKIAEKLITEENISIQKLVIGSIQTTASSKLKEQLKTLSTSSSSEFIKNISRQKLVKIN